MIAFIYRCPVTGLKVQGLFADEVPPEKANTMKHSARAIRKLGSFHRDFLFRLLRLSTLRQRDGEGAFFEVASMIGVSAIVLAGSSGQALAFGPGHVERTADAGERGVAVYAAHRDTHFRFLKDVAVGDEIEIARRDGKLSATAPTAPRSCASINPASTRSRPVRSSVLATCWQFDAIARGRVHMRKWSLSSARAGDAETRRRWSIWHWVAHTAREVAG